MGAARAARLLLYERESHWLKHSNINKLTRIGHRAIFGGLCGYGYKTHRALAWLLCVWFIGSLIFWTDAKFDLMRTASDQILTSNTYARRHLMPADSQLIQPVLYAFDVLVPMVDLGQKHAWVPAEGWPRIAVTGAVTTPGFERLLLEVPPRFHPPLIDFCASWLPKFWFWWETFFGWLLTTIVLAGLTGLVGHQRED